MRSIALRLAAAGEAGAGLLLLVDPVTPVRLLYGAEVNGPGIFVSRILGASLIGLGVACWPGKSSCQPLYGMLAYSILAMLCLGAVGLRGEGGRRTVVAGRWCSCHSLCSAGGGLEATEEFEHLGTRIVSLGLLRPKMNRSKDPGVFLYE